MSAKGILIFLGGTVVGGLAGYFIGKKASEVEHEADLCEMREFYDQRLDNELKKMNDSAHELAENIITLRQNTNKPPLSEIEKNYLEKAKVAAETGTYISDETLEQEYQEYYDELAKEDGEDTSKDTAAAMHEYHNAFDEGNTRIYEVDEQTVEDPKSDHDIEYLTYYDRDILAYTDDDEVLHDSSIAHSIGNTDILDNSLSREDKPVVYIRNDKTMVDYVVNISEYSYHEVTGHPAE